MFYPSIPPELQAWAMAQQVFFVASAPRVGKHINVSPKGVPSSSLAILGPNECAYVDCTGSGAETIAHVYENGRVTIMFCSFEASPRIMRFFCTGEVVEWTDKRFEPLLERMGLVGAKRLDGARAIIHLNVFKCQTSCGYGVPLLARVPPKADVLDDADEEKRTVGANEEMDGWVAGFRDRETMGHFARKKEGLNTMHKYQAEWNSDSLDGLTALRAAMRDRGQSVWVEEAKAWSRRMWGQRDAVGVGFTFAVMLWLLWNMLLVGVLR
jgi:hypothetical protein